MRHDVTIRSLTPHDVPLNVGVAAYARDKRRQVALAERFSELMFERGRSKGDSGTAVFSMHPGWVETEGLRIGMPGFHALFKVRARG